MTNKYIEWIEKQAQNIRWTEKDHKEMENNPLFQMQDRHPVGTHLGGMAGAFYGIHKAENSMLNSRLTGKLRTAASIGKGIAGVAVGATLGGIAGSTAAEVAHNVTRPKKKN